MAATPPGQWPLPARCLADPWYLAPWLPWLALWPHGPARCHLDLPVEQAGQAVWRIEGWFS